MEDFWEYHFRFGLNLADLVSRGLALFGDLLGEERRVERSVSDETEGGRCGLREIGGLIHDGLSRGRAKDLPTEGMDCSGHFLATSAGSSLMHLNQQWNSSPWRQI